ncbi:hypothetical protein [Muriicola soli]|uniref:hypothetical protein n=1 Tax=Muriicola soli TaxID=2507538 RepID=UPI0026C6C8D3
MNKKLLFTAGFFLIFSIQIIASNPLPEERGDDGFVVVLDAGHGVTTPATWVMAIWRRT